MQKQGFCHCIREFNSYLGAMVFCDSVLAFIKAFRLKGDVNALKHALH